LDDVPATDACPACGSRAPRTIAIEETIEKAAIAAMLPRELRSLGLGVLASANAVRDMASSLYVGVMLDAGRPSSAFAVPVAVGFAGLV